MDYTVLRSRRRTMALQITKDCQVLVRAPLFVSDADIRDFVDAHQEWIQTHLFRQQQRNTAHPQPTQKEIALLRQRAKAELPPLVAKWAQRMGVAPSGVKITSAFTRFGSCSSKNSLCFSLYLMRYPQEAIEAVVVHELAHIRHKNHGADFYRDVQHYLPDYCRRIALLKK